MADASSFTNLVPGFDFLQGLVKNASAALPSMGQWVAPTLNPEELEKRIKELKTVQFWLEQNARMLGATIQALEVQRMTLSTLQNMNVQMGDLREAMTIRMPTAPSTSTSAPASAPAPSPSPAPSPAPEPAPAPASASAGEAAEEKPASPGVVDPMQWWGALTKQFTELAASAIKDNASNAAGSIVGAMAKQSFDAAGETLKKAMAPIAATTARKSPASAKTTPAAKAKKPPARKRGPAVR
ncbi:hypothetical protein BH11PSE8_BH11PSE8_13160 [soil metagenome]